MFWEISGIGSEIMRLFCGIYRYWNTPPGYSFSGFLSLFLLLFSSTFGHSCFLHCCFRLWFLTVVSVSNTQGINSTSSWVYDYTSAYTDSTYVADGSARSDLPAGGQDELGGVS